VSAKSRQVTYIRGRRSGGTAAVGSDPDGQVNDPMNMTTYGRADEDPIFATCDD
jgi:hypothetical protein